MMFLTQTSQLTQMIDHVWLMKSRRCIVIDFNTRNNSIYEGPRGDKKIVQYKCSDLYNVVNLTRLPAFDGKQFFGEKCKEFFDYRIHLCFDPCHTCLHKEYLWVPNEKGNCLEHLKICRSAQCFEQQHKKSQK